MSIQPEEISQLLDSHWGALVAWIGSTPDAEDIVQQTFVALAGLSEAPENPKAWLYRTAKNKAINTHKSSKRRLARHRLVSKSERATVAVNSEAENSELRELMEKLTQEQRAIVSARLWGQLTFDEIADLHGSSKATVWRIYSTAIQSLREFYGVSSEAKQ